MIVLQVIRAKQPRYVTFNSSINIVTISNYFPNDFNINSRHLPNEAIE